MYHKTQRSSTGFHKYVNTMDHFSVILKTSTTFQRGGMVDTRMGPSTPGPAACRRRDRESVGWRPVTMLKHGAPCSPVHEGYLRHSGTPLTRAFVSFFLKRCTRALSRYHYGESLNKHEFWCDIFLTSLITTGLILIVFPLRTFHANSYGGHAFNSKPYVYAIRHICRFLDILFYNSCNNGKPQSLNVS